MPSPLHPRLLALLCCGLIPLALGASACSPRSPLLQLSGHYLCQSPEECPDNWTCQANAQAQKVCVSPSDSSFVPAPAPDGGGSAGDTAGSVDLPPLDGDLGLPPGEVTPGSPNVPTQLDCERGPRVGCQSPGWYLECAPDGAIINAACETGEICDPTARSAAGTPCAIARGVRGRVEAFASVWDYSLGEPPILSGGASALFVTDSQPGPTRVDPATGTCELQELLADEVGGGTPFNAGRVDLVKNPDADLPDLLELVYDPDQGYHAYIAPDELEAGPCLDCAYNWMPFGGALDVSGEGFVTGNFADRLEMPDPRVLTEPGEMAEVSSEGLVVRWQGQASRAGDLLLLSVSSSGEGRWRIVCAPEDTGEITVPAELLHQLPNPSEVFIVLTALREKRVGNDYGELIVAGRHYHSRPVLLRD